MNFLAHLYLSGNDENIMIGNFIADSVKGKAYLKYKPSIQQGILLHRKIDEATDNHEITKELGLLFKSHYHKYSGIVTDIFYDHFLSKNWSVYSKQELNNYIKQCYKILLRNITIFPTKVQAFLPVMVAKNTLLKYSKIEGLKTALERMGKYTSMPSASNFAIDTLNKNYEYFNERFLVFFSDIMKITETEYKLINSHYTHLLK